MATKQKKTTTTTKTTGKTKPPKITLASVSAHAARLQLDIGAIYATLAQWRRDTLDSLDELQSEVRMLRRFHYILAPLAGVGAAVLLQLLTK